MKKLVSLIKNGQTYMVGSVQAEDLTALETKLDAKITANTESISAINTALEGIYTKSETDSAIETAIGAIDKEVFEFVDALPEDNIKSNKIYVIPNADGQGQNVYTEYLYIESQSKWEIVGQFKADTDLSNIYTKSEVYNKTETDNLLNDLDRALFYTQSAYDALETKNPHQLYGIYVEVATE